MKFTIILDVRSFPSCAPDTTNTMHALNFTECTLHSLMINTTHMYDSHKQMHINRLAEFHQLLESYDILPMRLQHHRSTMHMYGM